MIIHDIRVKLILNNVVGRDLHLQLLLTETFYLFIIRHVLHVSSTVNRNTVYIIKHFYGVWILMQIGVYITIIDNMTVIQLLYQSNSFKYSFIRYGTRRLRWSRSNLHLFNSALYIARYNIIIIKKQSPGKVVLYSLSILAYDL